MRRRRRALQCARSGAHAPLQARGSMRRQVPATSFAPRRSSGCADASLPLSLRPTAQRCQRLTAPMRRPIPNFRRWVQPASTSTRLPWRTHLSPYHIPHRFLPSTLPCLPSDGTDLHHNAPPPRLLRPAPEDKWCAQWCSAWKLRRRNGSSMAVQARGRPCAQHTRSARARARTSTTGPALRRGVRPIVASTTTGIPGGLCGLDDGTRLFHTSTTTLSTNRNTHTDTDTRPSTINRWWCWYHPACCASEKHLAL